MTTIALMVLKSNTKYIADSAHCAAHRYLGSVVFRASKNSLRSHPTASTHMLHHLKKTDTVALLVLCPSDPDLRGIIETLYVIE